MVYCSRKYRAYPTDTQAALLARTFGSVRFVWNNILDWRSKAVQGSNQIREVLESLGFIRGEEVKLLNQADVQSAHR